MIVTLNDAAEIETVRRALVERGLWVRPLQEPGSSGRVQFLVEEGSASVPAEDLRAIRGVEAVATGEVCYPRVRAQPPTVEIHGVRIGPTPDAAPLIMAGPCSVESKEQIRAIATRLGRLGVRFLRGGAYKARTRPDSFQGHGAAALGWLRDAADEQGMSVVTEAVGVEELEPVAEVTDLVQIGSRNMHNTPLLKAAGRCGKPVLLKRGMAATLDEWLHAAEYCLSHGAPAVLFCERGIRSFDPSTRNVLDLGAAVLLAHVYRQPVIVDPSHAAGRRDLIAPLCYAALAAGAAGLMLETHDDPGRALSDGPQALHADEIAAIVGAVRRAESRYSRRSS